MSRRIGVAGIGPTGSRVGLDQSVVKLMDKFWTQADYRKAYGMTPAEVQEVRDGKVRYTENGKEQV